MVDYDTLARVKMVGYAQSAGVNKSIVKLRAVNFKNYPLVENLSKTDYDLVSYDENGNILKSQHCLIKNKGTNMTDYGSFDDQVKAKKAASKFLTIEIGESAEYEFTGMKMGMNNFGEDAWIVSLKGLDSSLPEERKTWTFASLKIFDSFKSQNINEGDKILISREPKGGKSTYTVKKLK